MFSPEVSVVMSVYNGAKYLRESVESILSQEGVDFEYIIINDGSTDDSGDILSEYATRDNRVRIIEQENTGLTLALIRGCKKAKGKYIARQDAGDISFHKRLLKQVYLLDDNPDAVLVSCGTRFVGPNGECLYDIIQNNEEANNGLKTLSFQKAFGPPSHPSTMFRRATYEEVGGYRPQFYFAQDLDLWLRMVEVGTCLTIPELLYQTKVQPTSISGIYRNEQLKLKKYILECARLRTAGISETSILEKAALFRFPSSDNVSRFRLAKAFYFIGACVKQNDNIGARKYFKQAIKSNPFHFRSWLRLLFGHSLH